MTTETSPLPMGAALNSGYNGTVGIIGELDQSMTGNTILRVGNYTYATRTWQQEAHIVLTPDERDTLIAKLIAHRENAR